MRLGKENRHKNWICWKKLRGTMPNGSLFLQIPFVLLWEDFGGGGRLTMQNSLGTVTILGRQPNLSQRRSKVHYTRALIKMLPSSLPCRWEDVTTKAPSCSKSVLSFFFLAQWEGFLLLPSCPAPKPSIINRREKTCLDEWVYIFVFPPSNQGKINVQTHAFHSNRRIHGN